MGFVQTLCLHLEGRELLKTFLHVGHQPHASAKWHVVEHAPNTNMEHYELQSQLEDRWDDCPPKTDETMGPAETIHHTNRF